LSAPGDSTTHMSVLDRLYAVMSLPLVYIPYRVVPRRDPDRSGQTGTARRRTSRDQIPLRSRAGPRPCQGARGHFPLGHGTGRLTMLRSSSASGGAIIRGFGEYQPGRVITNADLASRLDTTDEW